MLRGMIAALGGGVRGMLGRSSGGGILVTSGALSPVLRFERAQAAGVRALGDVALEFVLVTSDAIDPALTFSRAQVAGVQSLGDV